MANDMNSFKFAADMDEAARYQALSAFLADAQVIEYKGVLFDEWTIDPETGSVYSEMCEDHAEQYRQALLAELSDGGMGACSVKGCDVIGMDADTSRHYYVDFDPEHIRVAERKAIAHEASVYLKQEPDATWSAAISPTSMPGYIKLCDEKAYPALLYFERYDINGSGVIDIEVCADREALLRSLNQLGQFRYSVFSLWDAHLRNRISPEAAKIFSDAYVKRCALAEEEMSAFFPEDKEPEKQAGDKGSLHDKIDAAEKRKAAGTTKDCSPLER